MIPFYLFLAGLVAIAAGVIPFFAGADVLGYYVVLLGIISCLAAGIWTMAETIWN